jgi:hypothetical protein
MDTMLSPLTKIRKIKSVMAKYETLQGIQYAANDITDPNTNPSYVKHYQDPTAITIAHSMGSLTSREVMRRHGNSSEGCFGGIVTFAGPHAGAGIGKSVYEREHIPFAQTALLEVGSPLISSLFGGSFSVTIGTEVILNLIPDKWLGSLLDTLIEDTKGAPYMRPQSSEMQLLNDPNNRQPNIRKIAIVGIEDQPVFWRIASTLMDTPSKYRANAFQGRDEKMVKISKLLGSAYTALSIKNTAVTVINPLQALTSGAPMRAYLWARGALFLFKKGNDLWQEFIEATTTVTQTINLGNIYMPQCDQVNCSACPFSLRRRCWSLRTVPLNITYNLKVNQNSDGVVTEATQEAFPGKIPYNRKAIGANHFELRNHPDVTRILEDVFNGGANGTNGNSSALFFKIQ